jgi:hypothetical protein
MKNGIYQKSANQYEVWKSGEHISTYPALVVAQLIAAQYDLPMKLQHETKDETNPR